MSPRELVETALRVLAAWTDGRKPASADVEALKRAFPSSAHLRRFRCARKTGCAPDSGKLPAH